MRFLKDAKQKDKPLLQMTTAERETQLQKEITDFKMQNIKNGGEVEEPPAALCAISNTPMQDPVIVKGSNQAYDRKNIQGWFKSGPFLKNHIDPRGAPLETPDCRTLIPAPALKQTIDDWAKWAKQNESGLGPSSSSSTTSSKGGKT